MKIVVADASVGRAPSRVRFSCAMGGCWAEWVGACPAVGEEKYVELVTSEPAILGKSLVESGEHPGIRAEGDRCAIVGEVVDFEDGVVRIDFGCGTLEVEVEGSTPTTGARYKLHVRDLKLYDANY